MPTIALSCMFVSVWTVCTILTMGVNVSTPAMGSWLRWASTINLPRRALQIGAAVDMRQRASLPCGGVAPRECTVEGTLGLTARGFGDNTHNDWLVLTVGLGMAAAVFVLAVQGWIAKVGA